MCSVTTHIFHLDVASKQYKHVPQLTCNIWIRLHDNYQYLFLLPRILIAYISEQYSSDYGCLCIKVLAVILFGQHALLYKLLDKHINGNYIPFTGALIREAVL